MPWSSPSNLLHSSPHKIPRSGVYIYVKLFSAWVYLSDCVMCWITHGTDECSLCCICWEEGIGLWSRVRLFEKLTVIYQAIQDGFRLKIT
jgi:hypothetical protein